MPRRAGCLAVAAKLHGTVKTVPYKQPEGKVSSGKMQISGRFVGDAYMRPVQFTRYIALPGGCNGRHICRPYKATRKIIIATKSRAGQCPAPAARFLNVPAARALLIYYLLSIIFYLLKTNRAPADSGGGVVFLTAPWTKMPSGARFRGLQKIPAGACPP